VSAFLRWLEKENAADVARGRNMEFDIFVLIIILTAASVWDLKERAIPVWFFIISMLMAIGAELCSGSVNITASIGGTIIGFMLLAISKLTGGQIGEGDGIVFLITGVVLGFKNNFLLLLEALFLSFVFSLVFLLLKKINIKTKLPFLPFVLVAFIMEMWFGG